MMTPAIEAARSDLIERMALTDPSYDASFDRIVRLLRSITGASAAAFTVLDGGRQFYKAHEGITQRETPRDVSFCTHTIEQPELMVVPDALQDPRFASSPLVNGPHGHRFYAGMPVRAPSGLPLGALCILDRQPRQIGDTERQCIDDLRDALEESLMLRSLAIVDPLTGLFNRRYFEDVASREWTRGLAAQAPLAVCMIDIDHFKKYNDTYGHPAGDACLRSVARCLRQGARRVGDLAARMGGEEFALLLPRISAEQAREAAAQILGLIADSAIEHRASPFGRVTASIGVAMVTDPRTQSLGEALGAADAALYAAKTAGRNTAVLAPES